MKFETSKNIPVVPHPPHSPSLAPCNLFMFPRLKTTLVGQKVEDVNETLRPFTNRPALFTFPPCQDRWRYSVTELL